MVVYDSAGLPAGICAGNPRAGNNNRRYQRMTITKTMNPYPVLFRAIEGIGLIVLMGACFALCWLLRREPIF